MNALDAQLFGAGCIGSPTMNTESAAGRAEVDSHTPPATDANLQVRVRAGEKHLLPEAMGKRLLA